jgi:formylglycine-generating enzyme required for sulfatase activity
MKSIRRIGKYIAVVLFFIPAHPCSGMISGTITDTLGRIVPGAVVTFTDEAYPSRSFTAITDAAGRYLIDITTSVNEHAPQPFSLEQNYPNPFNPSTIIPFTLQDAGRVNMTVYSILGQNVRTLIDGYFSVGKHSVTWNGADDRGIPAGAGVYICCLRIGNRLETKKMLLLDGGLSLAVGSAASLKSVDIFRAGEISTVALYRVTVLGDSIVSFREQNVALNDGEVHDFAVIGKVFHSTGITLVAIPGGVFQMGDEDGMLARMTPFSYTVHTVTVSSFRMSEAEITNSQYCAFLNAAFASGEISVPRDSLVVGLTGLFKGYRLINLALTREPEYPGNRCWITFSDNLFGVADGKENRPVVGVSWYGAKAFAYHYGWDLAREGEWEYACRGGKQYMWGTVDGTIDSTKARFWLMIEPQHPYEPYLQLHTHPVDVKSYPPNPFGLYDMSGNIWEWINDFYDTYPSEPVIDPTGPSTGSRRNLRGGGFGSGEMTCRAAVRSCNPPSRMDGCGGFRVVSR